MALVWLHGRGDTGTNWENSGVFNDVRSHGFITRFPTAPRRSMTCDGGRSTTAWFDMVATPVLPTAPDSPDGIEESVKHAHAILDELQAQGTPAEQIVLGGYSQGGATSLLAGLSYGKKLAGIVSIAGWCVNRQDVSAWITEEGKQSPVLMCFGDEDPIIDCSVARLSADLLQDVLGDGLEVLCAQRKSHQPDKSELDRAVGFTQGCLPKLGTEEENGTKVYSLCVLQEKRIWEPNGVEATQRELHLRNADFLQIFGMSKEEFARLPKWKQTQQKKSHGLF